MLTSAELSFLGLCKKDLSVYLALAKLGSAPLRKIAEEAGMSRSTVHDALKRLIALELASFVDATRHRYFTAEDPQHMRRLLSRKEVELKEAQERVAQAIPHIEALFGSMAYRPAVRYYEGPRGVREILQDVLSTTKRTTHKTYRVYSSAAVRDLIAQALPRYNTTRKQQGVKVRAISLGEGGKTYGLDERKWLSRKQSSPAYIFIYEKKTAYIFADSSQRLFGVIIDDSAVAQTQQIIFDELWKHL